MKRILFLICILQIGYMSGQKIGTYIDKDDYLTYIQRPVSTSSDTEITNYSGYTIDIPKLEDGFRIDVSLHVLWDNYKQGILIRIFGNGYHESVYFNKFDYTPRDSIYVPSNDDLNRLFDIIGYEDFFWDYEPDDMSLSEPDPEFEYFIDVMEYMKRDIARKTPRRRHLIIETSKVLILLFNIKEENFDEFKKYAETFRFLDDDEYFNEMVK